jgi:site-specific recombinase XerD
MPTLTFPRTHKNTDVRSREYLTPQEVERLRTAARRQGRQGLRNDTMILLAYRHGLRVSELVTLRWEQVDLQGGLVHVHRVKRGIPSTHPLTGVELRALRQLHRQRQESPYVFNSERGGPMTVNNAQKMIQKAGQAAGFAFPVHWHMCRHGTGYKLANDGQDTRAIQYFLGHRNITHTARYCELAPNRFRQFWRD